MKQTIIAFLLSTSLILSTGFFITSTKVAASGTTTLRNQPGDTVIRDEDGVLYLTNEQVPGEATISGSRRIQILSTGFQVPQGFADDIGSVINAVLSFVMAISALLVLMYLVWGAFGWLTSGGDKGKIDAARQKMMAAVVGLIIVSASYAILLLAIRFLGFTSLADVFDSVRTIEGDGQGIDFVQATPTPTPVVVYDDDLGELIER